MNYRKTFLLLFLFCCFSTNLFSQNKLFFYKHTFVKDSTNRANKTDEIMVLNIEKGKSEFYSYDKFKSDSIILSNSKKGILTMPENKEYNNERIIKQENSLIIDYVNQLSLTQYWTKQNVKINWQLASETGEYLGYKTQKAVGTFGGRKWIAWFTTEIPIQNGPFKFFGLPGLIVKIEDNNANHSFELVETKIYPYDKFEYPMLNNFRKIQLSFLDYKKMYLKYRKNPTADSQNSFVDYKDDEGIEHKAVEMLKEYNKAQLEKIKKDNNIIELDLLHVP